MVLARSYSGIAASVTPPAELPQRQLFKVFVPRRPRSRLAAEPVAMVPRIIASCLDASLRAIGRLENSGEFERPDHDAVTCDLSTTLNGLCLLVIIGYRGLCLLVIIGYRGLPRVAA